MTDYQKHPKAKPDMNAGRSAKPVSQPMKGEQMGSHGSMGKHQKTGDGMENERGAGKGGGY